MESIIQTIENSVRGPDFANKPCMIYMGVGTFAGLTSTDQNGQIYLEDKNYHQFLPCIRKIFTEHRDMHLFIILIDPLQENPLHMTTDQKLNRELFENSEWIHIQEDCEMYINDRITVFPFRHAVSFHSYEFFEDSSSLDITNYLAKLNQLSIDNSLTFVYHDFTGKDTPLHLQKLFEKQTENNLDHIIYGVGGGFVSGCDYDFTSPEAQLPTIIEYEHRKIIKIFSLRKLIHDFEFVKYHTDFNTFINITIGMFTSEFIEIISSQMKNMRENFKYSFKNYVFYIFRLLKNFETWVDTPEKNRNVKDIMYYSRKISGTISEKILDLIDTRDPMIFQKIVDEIGNFYEGEITMILSGTKYWDISSNEVMKNITSDPDPYKWFTSFNDFFE